MAITAKATMATTLAALIVDAQKATHGNAIQELAEDILDEIGNALDSADHVLTNYPVTITFVAAAGGANVCEVTVTVVDNEGNAVALPHMMEWWLSDAATGIGLTGTAASGTVAAKSASGTDLEVVTAKKHTRVQTLATGIYIIEITDSAKTAFYPCASFGHKIFVGTVLATGDYGS